MNYRLYTFVANHYLSPLQCGLQTAHVVGELSREVWSSDHRPFEVYVKWATVDKTIIICAAGNHAGVVETFTTLRNLSYPLHFLAPTAIFHEDEQSMNGMATACGIIVPDRIYDAKPIPDFPYEGFGIYDEETFEWSVLSPPEAELHLFLKSFRLA